MEKVSIYRMDTALDLTFPVTRGILADKFGRRKVIVYFTAFRILTPILYLSATSWSQLIPGLKCEALGSAYLLAYNALMADSSEMLSGLYASDL